MCHDLASVSCEAARPPPLSHVLILPRLGSFPHSILPNAVCLLWPCSWPSAWPLPILPQAAAKFLVLHMWGCSDFQVALGVMEFQNPFLFQESLTSYCLLVDLVRSEEGPLGGAHPHYSPHVPPTESVDGAFRSHTL